MRWFAGVLLAVCWIAVGGRAQTFRPNASDAPGTLVCQPEYAECVVVCDHRSSCRELTVVADDVASLTVNCTFSAACDYLVVEASRSPHKASPHVSVTVNSDFQQPYVSINATGISELHLWCRHPGACFRTTLAASGASWVDVHCAADDACREMTLDVFNADKVTIDPDGGGAWNESFPNNTLAFENLREDVLAPMKCAGWRSCAGTTWKYLSTSGAPAVALDCAGAQSCAGVVVDVAASAAYTTTCHTPASCANLQYTGNHCRNVTVLCPESAPACAAFSCADGPGRYLPPSTPSTPAPSPKAPSSRGASCGLEVSFGYVIFRGLVVFLLFRAPVSACGGRGGPGGWFWGGGCGDRSPLNAGGDGFGTFADEAPSERVGREGGGAPPLASVAAAVGPVLWVLVACNEVAAFFTYAPTVWTLCDELHSPPDGDRLLYAVLIPCVGLFFAIAEGVLSYRTARHFLFSVSQFLGVGFYFVLHSLSSAPQDRRIAVHTVVRTGWSVEEVTRIPRSIAISTIEFAYVCKFGPASPVAASYLVSLALFLLAGLVPTVLARVKALDFFAKNPLSGRASARPGAAAPVCEAVCRILVVGALLARRPYLTGGVALAEFLLVLLPGCLPGLRRCAPGAFAPRFQTTGVPQAAAPFLIAPNWYTYAVKHGFLLGCIVWFTASDTAPAARALSAVSSACLAITLYRGRTAVVGLREQLRQRGCIGFFAGYGNPDQAVRRVELQTPEEWGSCRALGFDDEAVEVHEFIGCMLGVEGGGLSGGVTAAGWSGVVQAIRRSCPADEDRLSEWLAGCVASSAPCDDVGLHSPRSASRDVITPLAHVVCEKRYAVLLNVLIEHGLTTEAPDANGLTPLMHLCIEPRDFYRIETRHPPAESYAGKAVSIVHEEFERAKHAQLAMLQALLASSADPVAYLEAVGPGGKTALHHAIEGGNYEMVDVLTDRTGLAADFGGYLRGAVEVLGAGGREEIVAKLFALASVEAHDAMLRRGADGVRTGWHDLALADFSRFTTAAALPACVARHAAAIAGLTTNDASSDTVIHYTARSPTPAGFRRLFEAFRAQNGSTAAFFARNGLGATPLVSAVTANRPENVAAILEAAQSGDLPLVDLLGQKDRQGRNVYHHAFSPAPGHTQRLEARLRIVQELLERLNGAEGLLNAPDCNGDTVGLIVVRACIDGRPGADEFLAALEPYPVSYTIRNANGETAKKVIGKKDADLKKLRKATQRELDRAKDELRASEDRCKASEKDLSQVIKSGSPQKVLSVLLLSIVADDREECKQKIRELDEKLDSLVQRDDVLAACQLAVDQELWIASQQTTACQLVFHQTHFEHRAQNHQ
ncbi:hypothetical protein DIPPA_13272 [Diplonema papillatum]|nr:hypothetical protein DIPPA_13272 [Diplonema papillatum]